MSEFMTPCQCDKCTSGKEEHVGIKMWHHYFTLHHIRYTDTKQVNVWQGRALIDTAMVTAQDCYNTDGYWSIFRAADILTPKYPAATGFSYAECDGRTQQHV